MSYQDNTARAYADEELSKKYAIGTSSQKGRVYSDYDKLKRRIYREFPKKKLIGDIVINDEEFQILVEYLRSFFNYLRLLDWELCTDPLICVAMIQIGIRYYDGGYWPHFATMIDNRSWNVNRQAVMANVCLETLRAYDKYVLDGSDRINTILMHGFVANKYAYNLMDFLFAYYRIDLDRDLTRNDRDMMRELIQSIQNKDNTNRTYKLVQQTSDAVSCNPRGCNIRLRWLLRLINASFWDEELRINPSNRLSRLFGEWAEQSTDLQRSRGFYGSRKRGFSSPHITFNTADGQFYLILPFQLIKSDQDVAWSLSIGAEEQRITTEAFEAVTGFKTEIIERRIPTSAIFNKMVMNLEYGDSVKRFMLPAERVRFFNKDGASVNITSLRAGEYYAFSNESNAIVSTALLECRRHAGLWFYYLNFEEGDIVKTIDGKAVSVGRKIEEGLLSRGIIKEARESNDGLPIYSKVPTVLIKIPENRLPGTAIIMNGQKSRLQEACKLTEIQLNDGTNCTGYWFNLSDIGCVRDGKYEVTIDVPNDRSVRSWKFVLLKCFECSFDDRAPYIFESRGTVHVTAAAGSRIKPTEKNIEEDSEAGFYNFSISSLQRELGFVVNGIPVEISVPQLEYSFDNEEWNTMKHTEIWHTDLPRKIWIRFPSSRLSLELDNGEVTEEELNETFDKKLSENVFECDITRFRSWINHDQIRNKLYLNVNDKSISFLDIIARSYVVDVIPEADFDKRLIVINADIIGKSDYFVDVRYEDELIAEKVPLQDMTAEISSPIRSGKYRIEVFESDAKDEFGFDELYYSSIYRTRTSIVNPRDLTGKTVEILSIMRDEQDYFKMPFKHQYIVRDLIPLDEDGYIYEGTFTDRQNNLISVKVRFELLGFERLRYGLINWIDPEYDEDNPFLYDSYEKILVCEEKEGLRSSERYRRYECIFTDDYLYEIRVLTQGR